VPHGKSASRANAHDVLRTTNNHAEQLLRGFVLWRKRSFVRHSPRGKGFAERVMTLVDTGRTQGADVREFFVGWWMTRRDRSAAPLLFARSVSST
jgi:hypothetical protein